jgi:hypothetical protein
MSHIIKVFLITFSFCYIGNISRLTSGIKVTSDAIYEVNLVNITLYYPFIKLPHCQCKIFDFFLECTYGEIPFQLLVHKI